MKSIGLYEGMAAFNVLMVAGLALFLCKTAMTKHTVFEYLAASLLLGSALLVNHNTGEKGFLLYLAVALGIKGVGMRDAFRAGAAVWIAGFGISQALVLSGLLPDHLFLHPKHFFGTVLCHGLAYAHPNVLHTSYLVVCAFVLYLVPRTRRALITAVLLLFAGNILVFMYSFSFTGFAACVFYLFLHTYLSVRGTLTRAEEALLAAAFPVFVLFSVFGPLLIKGRLFDIINSALNTRFALSRYFLTEQPFTLFGTTFTVPEGSRYTIDCSYVYALMRLGIIPFIVLMVWYFMTILSLIKRKEYAALAVLYGIAFAGLAEPLMFNSSMKNLAFLFLGEYAYLWSGKLAPRLAPALKREIILVSFGGQEDARTGAKETRESLLARYLASVNRNSVPLLIVAILGAVVIGCAADAAMPEIGTVYVDEALNDGQGQTPLIMSGEEAMALREDKTVEVHYGAPISDAGDGTVTLYAFGGETARAEELNRGFLIGAVGAFVSGLIASILFFARTPVKEHKI